MGGTLNQNMGDKILAVSYLFIYRTGWYQTSSTHGTSTKPWTERLWLNHRASAEGPRFDTQHLQLHDSGLQQLFF